ncbi:MAG TPA: hypothetical protein VFS21_03340 [Roseiflexaceae bacterium]|nr:hypothetical protein [Roseiflexaceae bacterium]
MIATNRSRVARYGLIAMLLSLMLAALAACGSAPTGTGGTGGTGGTASEPTAAPTAAPAAGPDVRVKDFFGVFGDALSDPDLGEEAKQDEWAGKMAAFALPADQDKAKTEIKKTLKQVGDAFNGMNQAVAAQNMDVKLQISFKDVATEIQEQSGDTAKVGLTGGVMKVELTGADVEKLGEAAAQANQEMPLTDFLKQSGSKSTEGFNMKLENNTWYFADLATGL